MLFKIQHPQTGEFWCGAQLSFSDSSVYELRDGTLFRNTNTGLNIRYLADRVLYESEHGDYAWFVSDDGKITTSDGYVVSDGNSLKVISFGPCVNWKIIKKCECSCGCDFGCTGCACDCGCPKLAPVPEPEAPAPTPEPEAPAPTPEPEAPAPTPEPEAPAPTPEPEA
jgi:hypothetical protein